MRAQGVNAAVEDELVAVGLDVAGIEQSSKSWTEVQGPGCPNPADAEGVSSAEVAPPVVRTIG